MNKNREDSVENVNENQFSWAHVEKDGSKKRKKNDDDHVNSSDLGE